MATDFATAPAFGVRPTHQYPLYGQGTGYSPINSATATPSNVSPTSTHTATTLSQLHLQSRQLRPPKTPLYVPAVLRPTEKPVRHSPPKHGAGRSHLEGDGLGDTRSRHGPHASIGSTISRIVSDEWNDDALGAVTGPPTRNHWKPDPSVSVCDIPACPKAFTFFERRHHCRRCGNIFCAEHSPHAVPLDQHARFHPQGARYRACDFCWADYKTWETARASRSNSDSSQAGSPNGLPAGLTPGLRIGCAAPGQGLGDARVGSFAGSVPRDWNWSTF